MVGAKLKNKNSYYLPQNSKKKSILSRDSYTPTPPLLNDSDQSKGSHSKVQQHLFSGYSAATLVATEYITPSGLREGTFWASFHGNWLKKMHDHIQKYRFGDSYSKWTLQITKVSIHVVLLCPLVKELDLI